MAAPQKQQEPAWNGFGLVHRVAQSPLGDLWLALDQRRGSPGKPVLVRDVSLSSGATLDTLERVAAAGRAAMSLRSELLLPAVEVLQQGSLAVAYEYVEAQPLSVLQASARARELLFPVGVCLRLIIDLLRALQTVHESWPGWPTEAPFGGLLPGSVLVSRDGRTRLCDALVSSSALLQRGCDLGADELAYRAPEQVYASTAPEPSADVFIATILLWELLSGRRLLSGDKETIERKLLEHALPRASSDLRPDCQLSRGLLELLDSGLSLDPSQRPGTPGAFAKALERCRQEVASTAEVAAFMNELAGSQLDRTALIVQRALAYAGGADEAQLAGAAATVAASDIAAAPSEVEAPPPSVATRASRVRASKPRAAPGSAKPAGAAPPGAVAKNLLARSLARARERRQRASAEFAAFTHSPAASPPPATYPEIGPAPQPLTRYTELEREAAAGTAPRAAALPLVPALPGVPLLVSVPLLPLPPDEDGGAAMGLERDDQLPSSQDEVTTVQRALGGDDAIGRFTPTPLPGPIRLAPKRALLAVMAGVVLLIQLWMFGLARSRLERQSSDETPARELPEEPAPPAQHDRGL